VRLSDKGALRGEVLATEYLGTTQIVTLRTEFGEVKARIASDRMVTPHETAGLDLDARTLSVFDTATGRALRSAGNEGVLGDG
jgi:multiple sugar transport system ATP-binding protein